MKTNATKRAKTVERNQKTQDETIAEFNRARQPYLDLLKSLDDNLTAQKFRDKQLNRAKELLSYIFMVTSGAFVAPDNQDWAHEHLIEILEMFMVRHENFERSQFAEDLQECIYRETFAYSDTSIDWKKDVLAKRGLDENGVELSETDKGVLDLPEQPEVSNEGTFSDAFIEKATRHSHMVWANKISHVLESEEVPENIKSVISDVLITVAGEANVGIDAPELVKDSFPLFMDALDPSYRTGVMHSIQNIIESGSPESVIDELRQYEKHMITGKTIAEEEAEISK